MKINIPTDWSGVTIAEYQAIQSVLNEDAEEYDKNMAIISIVTGQDIEYIEKFSLTTYAKCVKALSFLTKPLQQKKVKKFFCKGKKYRVFSDVYDFNGGQYITLMHLLKDPDKVMDNLHELMAVFCVPYEKKWYGWKRVKYKSKNHSEVAKEMLEVPMSIVQPLSAFFLANYLKSTSHILEYSVKKLEVIKAKAENQLAHLKADTVG